MPKNSNSLFSSRKIKELFHQYNQRFFSSPYKKFNLNWFQVKYYKHAGKNKQYTHKFSSRLPVHFTDPQAFLLSVRELFIEEIYRFRPETDRPRILDCGAHIGMSVLFFKLYYPNAKLTAFEPDQDNFRLASKNIDTWQFKDVELLSKAIWTTNGQIQFRQTHDMGSNIVQPGETSATTADTITMDCVRLNDLLEKEEIDFLKLDIEGAEFEVIKDCQGSLRRAKNLFIEYHGNYDEMHKLSTIFTILTAQKFAYYIKEAGNIYPRPLYDNEKNYSYDVQLNIFCKRL
jgi:FkbM family methyltransferase